MNDIFVNVLSKYTRAIFHMRRQLHRDRFGLVFGAGISKPWKIPNWKELNQKIARDSKVRGGGLLDLACSDTLLTQRLFEHFKAKRYAKEPGDKHHTVSLDRRIRKEWRDIIHHQLYADAPQEDDVSKIEGQHPYISEFVRIMRQAPLTVNYNFDDFLERILAHHRDEYEKERTRGFEPAWDIRFPFRSNRRVIYHPNGYLPENIMEASEEIVLSEDEFAEQLLGAMTGQYASLIHHLSRNTCLLIGLSLEDTTLKHILRQVARSNPGQYHYYVHYYKSGKEPRELDKEAISEANFSTYNLVTLFLCDEEISALGHLVGEGCDLEEDRDLNIRRIALENNLPTRYCYYIVGAVGAGKSTIVMHFRNLIAYDEWFEPRALKLGDDPDTLPADEVEELDKWIGDQFCKRNHKLTEEPLGVFIIDRCPLDPVSFTPANQWSMKAEKLLEAIAPGNRQQVMEGRVILIINDPEVLAQRLIMTEKHYTKDRLAQMQEYLKTIYKIDGVIVLDVTKMSLAEIIKRIAQIIHLEDYKPPANVHKRLLEISEGKVECKT